MKQYRLLNLTPHVIRFRALPGNDPAPQDGDVTYPSVGLARVGAKGEQIAEIEAVTGDGTSYAAPIICQKYGEVTGLPEPEAGVLYIVSLLVMQAMPDRVDLIGPATGPLDGAVRDEKGQVYAVRQWQSVAGRLPDL